MEENQPINQKQHRISQVYLKQFGHIKEDKHWLSVLKVETGITGNVLIKDFTAETNIFDLPIDDFEIKRHFENLSGQVENFYRTVISNLHNQKRLTPKDKDVLNHFVANLLCRTQPFRNFISECLNDSESRNFLIDEVTIYSDDTEANKFILNHFEKNHHLNLVIGTVMNHLVHVFRHFKKVIMRDYKNLGWLTTDNPVRVERLGINPWIIPLEAEIYLPLSKDFCLFMYHPESELHANPLRKLRIDKVNILSFDEFNKISLDNARNFYEYLIFCNETEETELRK
ncbi:hypothetical protein H4V97_000809 [Flavobacterium sp. CG_23.5]|uniref:DUF4238 domain-containing protein n=1 Tax=Flavobacterium sp. CG_23.5 TaxID=2760708 RepID=UPI001AE5E6A5|nr:DUF4238 domain-containing protein [Flavobacterium sp. CG_23.5]MBP2282491.1 hypothetical protein [Flavobacterium sp. CG_23.5]